MFDNLQIATMMLSAPRLAFFGKFTALVVKNALLALIYFFAVL